MVYWILGGIFTLAGLVILIAALFRISMEKKKADPAQSPASDKGRKDRVGKEKSAGQSRPSGRKRQWKIILENRRTGEPYTFVFYDVVAIGRGHSVEAYEQSLSLKEDARVSKIHCLIKCKNDKLFLVDMESRNGTRLNGRQIEGPVGLQKEDVLTVGGTQLELVKILREKE